MSVKALNNDQRGDENIFIEEKLFDEANWGKTGENTSI